MGFEICFKLFLNFSKKRDWVKNKTLFSGDDCVSRFYPIFEKKKKIVISFRISVCCALLLDDREFSHFLLWPLGTWSYFLLDLIAPLSLSLTLAFNSYFTSFVSYFNSMGLAPSNSLCIFVSNIPFRNQQPMMSGASTFSSKLLFSENVINFFF